MQRNNCVGSDFGARDLHSANLTGVHWTSCELKGACLEEADCSSAIFRLCNFDEIRAQRANFDGARLEDSSAVGADFSRATFRGAHLTETSFSRARLREAILDGAEGDGIDCRGADLRGASLRNVHFLQPDFRGADLIGADLSGATLKGADFRGALLDGAEFDGTNLDGATFDVGAGPLPAATADEPRTEAEDTAALNILQEFLAALPAATAGAQPAETMKRMQGLIDTLAASWGYSPEQREALRNQLMNYDNAPLFDPATLQKMIAALNSNSTEPPAELKAWLEPLIKAMEKKERP